MRCFGHVLVMLTAVAFVDAMMASNKDADIKGYVYMNVLGMYDDDKTYGVRLALKVGQAGPTRLATRMQEEYSAAEALGVRSGWFHTSTAESLDVWEISHNPAERGEDTLPYVKVTGNVNLGTAENGIFNAWVAVPGAEKLTKDQSRKWFAAQKRVHDPEVLQGTIQKLGAMTELVAVPLNDVKRVRAEADAVIAKSPEGWGYQKCKNVIGSKRGDMVDESDESDEKEWVPNPVDVANASLFDFEKELRQKVDAIGSKMTVEQLDAFQTLLAQLKSTVDDTFSKAPLAQDK